ncbi:radical SAM family heme chaperone HemW [Spirosoma oryzicola]|uniref:radical SAM family heme chaperone HemW n=1 Tax=Spirosoma oryzicola TaxID=2898794 RepID=UPI001E4280EC|nr:radical SAM family heme chaperone HemW [Spirosoma oryzicola]UHG92324.1 radical SAM family heme chaperone HemW [Spirosoma oryzicola]
MHLYLHIPFCKQACHYCDFHFSTNLSQKSALVEAICAEIKLQKEYLSSKTLQTVYFGGGTPSLLTEAELARIFETIHNEFSVSPTAEITLEANPDDLQDQKLQVLRRYVNRLSIGLQTFDEPTLRWMNRAHTAAEAETCVWRAREAGFENMSVDLIYGIPDPTTTDQPATLWQTDLQKMLALDVPHLSAYALTIEPDTAFGRWKQKGKLPAVDENLAAEQFEELTKVLTTAGYEHYEISNFAKPGQYARHNTAYWQRKPYLGVGPSAHSYTGFSRQYNIANNARYVTALQNGEVPATVETLTIADQVNEYLLTGLRTKWGCSLTELDTLLGGDFSQTQSSDLAAMYASGWLVRDNDQLRLTEAGKLFADRVAASLFVE